MKFAHNYKLKKDMPKYKVGWPLRWNGNDEKFYFAKASTWGYNKGEPDIYLDRESGGFTLEEIKNTEWFEPDGKEKDFIPKFPSKKNLEEFVYLDFETRLVNDVDECRAMNKLFNSKKFQDELYEFVKEKYNDFHALPNKEVGGK